MTPYTLHVSSAKISKSKYHKILSLQIQSLAGNHLLLYWTNAFKDSKHCLNLNRVIRISHDYQNNSYEKIIKLENNVLWFSNDYLIAITLITMNDQNS